MGPHLCGRELGGELRRVELLRQQLGCLLRLREGCRELGRLLPNGLVEGQAGLAEGLLEGVGCCRRLLLRLQLMQRVTREHALYRLRSTDDDNDCCCEPWTPHNPWPNNEMLQRSICALGMARRLFASHMALEGTESPEERVTSV